MALPIFAYYMQKIYADKELDITQDDRFDLPADFDPCALTDDGVEEEDDMQEVVE